MSTLQVEGIRNAAASSDAITFVADGTCTAKITNNLSNRNLIINGNHQISQRHTTKTGVTGEYLTDRWAAWGDAMTFDRVAITSASTGPWTEGHRYSLRVKNEAAGSDATATGQYITYKIEAQDMANSGWDYIQASSKIALSFWVKTSVAGTYYGSFWTSDGTAKAYNFSLGALSANTWTKVTKIIPGHADLQFDVNNDQGIRLNLYTHRSTNNTASDAVMDSWHNIDYNKTAPDVTHAFNTTVNATYEFTGVQLEVGHATDFEHRSYGDELARCQRYCWVTSYVSQAFIANGTSWNADSVGGAIHLPVPMRADPQMTVSSGNDFESTMVFSNTDTLSGGLLRPYSSAPPYQQVGWRGINSGAFTTGQAVILRFKDGQTGGKITVHAEL